MSGQLVAIFHSEASFQNFGQYGNWGFRTRLSFVHVGKARNFACFAQWTANLSSPDRQVVNGRQEMLDLQVRPPG